MINYDESTLLDKGDLQFSIEGRILRELGERLVKQPQVALVELVKNAFDADATFCHIDYEPPEQISIEDDGCGMTLEEFTSGWMRIGTSSKEGQRHSRLYGRDITGEKGIGRFAVRFLGRELTLESVARDEVRGGKTKLTAYFDWPAFDHHEDLGAVKVPYTLTRAKTTAKLGTKLTILKLRPSAKSIDLHAVRTAAIGVVTPYHALLKTLKQAPSRALISKQKFKQDAGFALQISPGIDETDGGDLAKTVLDNFVIRAVATLSGSRLKLSVYRKGGSEPALEINDQYENTIGPMYADIRFYPRRKGTFTDLPLDGRKATTWVKEHGGVAVFDRKFRVHPYGASDDDWLSLSADTAKREREPKSSIAKKHFPMDEFSRKSTQLNYMLRLPYPQQLVGIVQVVGRRTQDQTGEDDGLIAAADREGFVANIAYRQLRDIIRGAVEAIAAADREWQQELDVLEHDALLEQLKSETKQAIQEIQDNPHIGRPAKLRLVQQLTHTQSLATQYHDQTKEREASLEVMSLLGVVAGFMTHEFGTALDELKKAHEKLTKLAKRDKTIADATLAISENIRNLSEFVSYSQGYIQGASSKPAKPYPVRPRILQVKRVFGQYAADRKIDVEIEVDAELMAPLVPVSLYNGIALNLYTNALKAVTAKSGAGRRVISFHAWSDTHWHYLEVSDTGVGIPTALRKRVFDAMFTTTSNNRDPLGSGMGLGLALVKQSVESYGGRAQVVDPPDGFVTSVRLRLPL